MYSLNEIKSNIQQVFNSSLEELQELETFGIPNFWILTFRMSLRHFAIKQKPSSLHKSLIDRELFLD